jgi:hypothetical protein
MKKQINPEPARLSKLGPGVASGSNEVMTEIVYDRAKTLNSKQGNENSDMSMLQSNAIAIPYGESESPAKLPVSNLRLK